MMQPLMHNHPENDPERMYLQAYIRIKKLHISYTTSTLPKIHMLLNKASESFAIVPINMILTRYSRFDDFTTFIHFNEERPEASMDFEA